jgi:hypothetical protein
MTMLLTILLVVDESNLEDINRYKRTIESSFATFDIWKGSYEVLTATPSDEELNEGAGEFSMINALLVQNDHLSQCSGKYIWILPCFIGMNDNKEMIPLLFDVLSMGVDAVGLNSYPNYSNQKQVEIVSVALDLLPITQHFDEFRYIIRQETLKECFAKDSGFFTTLTYLSFKESQNTRPLYAIIPFNLFIVEGIVGNTFYLLCNSFFSGNRPWQRETIFLSRCLSYISKSQINNKLSKGQRNSFIHILFSSCSALESVSSIIFNENSSSLIKTQAVTFANQLLISIKQLSGLPDENQNLFIQISKLSYFFNNWQKIVSMPIDSENISNPEDKESILDGIWWLGKELKGQLNQIGEQTFLNSVKKIRYEIELS